jgi:peptidoglycan/xylan/chitin deacetylase (PgdA/CDA1 family)
MVKELWSKIFGHASGGALILMYHQVCEKKSDPWDMAVHPENFASQLYYLRKNFHVVSIDELSNCIMRKKLSKKLIAITFDDGFEDSYTNAAPMLEWLKLPATFYIPTHAIASRQQFWWEELQTIVLQSEELPKKVALCVGGHEFQFRFNSDNILRGKLTREIKNWRANMPIPNERIRLYYDLWQYLQPLPYTQQQQALAEIKNWSLLIRPTKNDNGVMSLQQVRKLSENALFRIGAHTVTHARLGSQAVADQAFEIEESKKVLEGWINKPVTGFAYPYGNYNVETKKLLHEKGFKYAVSTEGRRVKYTDDRYALPRIHVKNWKVDEFDKTIRELSYS